MNVKSRVEAFSDGVIAIIITILVLELKLPEHHHSLEAILELKYNFIAYAVSFIAIATIWISHHHLLNQISEINNKILWANINFLFGYRYYQPSLHGLVMILCHGKQRYCIT